MTDIVNTLRGGFCERSTGCGVLKTCVCAFLDDAADEIERLRAMVDQCNHHEDQLQEINVEVDKLTADAEGYLRLAASYKADLDEHTETIKRLKQRDGFIEKLNEQIERLREAIASALERLGNGDAIAGFDILDAALRDKL